MGLWLGELRPALCDSGSSLLFWGKAQDTAAWEARRLFAGLGSICSGISSQFQSHWGRDRDLQQEDGRLSSSLVSTISRASDPCCSEQCQPVSQGHLCKNNRNSNVGFSSFEMMAITQRKAWEYASKIMAELPMNHALLPKSYPQGPGSGAVCEVVPGRLWPCRAAATESSRLGN